MRRDWRCTAPHRGTGTSQPLRLGSYTPALTKPEGLEGAAGWQPLGAGATAAVAARRGSTHARSAAGPRRQLLSTPAFGSSVSTAASETEAATSTAELETAEGNSLGTALLGLGDRFPVTEGPQSWQWHARCFHALSHHLHTLSFTTKPLH